MDIPYFMDSCSLWELQDVLDNLAYLDRNLWEAARLNAYVNAQTHSKKSLTFEDICKFKWDEGNSITSTEISNADIARLREKAKILELELKNEHIQN